MLKYRKASFPKSVLTTFVVHCSSSYVRFTWDPVHINLTSHTDYPFLIRFQCQILLIERKTNVEQP